MVCFRINKIKFLEGRYFFDFGISLFIGNGFCVLQINIAVHIGSISIETTQNGRSKTFHAAHIKGSNILADNIRKRRRRIIREPFIIGIRLAEQIIVVGYNIVTFPVAFFSRQLYRTFVGNVIYPVRHINPTEIVYIARVFQFLRGKNGMAHHFAISLLAVLLGNLERNNVVRTFFPGNPAVKNRRSTTETTESGCSILGT